MSKVAEKMKALAQAVGAIEKQGWTPRRARMTAG